MNGAKGPRAEYRVGVGASSILMIFIILCLTTLGVLSFASARANLQLTERRQVQVQSYYTAEAEAQRLLSQIDAALLAARKAPETAEDITATLLALDPRIEAADEGAVALRLPVGQTQELRMTIRIGGPEDSARYTVAEQYLINIEAWEPNNMLDLPSETPAPVTLNDIDG